MAKTWSKASLPHKSTLQRAIYMERGYVVVVQVRREPKKGEGWRTGSQGSGFSHRQRPGSWRVGRLFGGTHGVNVAEHPPENPNTGPFAQFSANLCPQATHNTPYCTPRNTDHWVSEPHLQLSTWRVPAAKPSQRRERRTGTGEGQGQAPKTRNRARTAWGYKATSLIPYPPFQ